MFRDTFIDNLNPVNNCFSQSSTIISNQTIAKRVVYYHQRLLQSQQAPPFLVALWPKDRLFMVKNRNSINKAPSEIFWLSNIGCSMLNGGSEKLVACCFMEEGSCIALRSTSNNTKTDDLMKKVLSLYAADKVASSLHCQIFQG